MVHNPSAAAARQRLNDSVVGELQAEVSDLREKLRLMQEQSASASGVPVVATDSKSRIERRLWEIAVLS